MEGITSRASSKQLIKVIIIRDHYKVKKEEEDMDDFGEYVNMKTTKGCGGGSAAGPTRCCQADKCTADLRDAKPYHRRHKVCEHHAKAQAVVVAGIRQRFCQQCSRFHELPEFDEAKRSCRKRLAGHNERRRKNSSDPHAENFNPKVTRTQMKEIVCGQVDDRGRISMIQDDTTTCKHFQIR